DSRDWINLLESVRKLELDNLSTAIGNYLVKEEKKWIQQNILTIHKFTQSTGSLNTLLNYCNQIMASQPDLIFKSNDIASLPKETLITLLKNDELNMNEGDIWLSVVRWAVQQVPNLANEQDGWSSND